MQKWTKTKMSAGAKAIDSMTDEDPQINFQDIGRTLDIASRNVPEIFKCHLGYTKSVLAVGARCRLIHFDA